MFGFPAMVKAIFLPSMEQGIPTVVPHYEQFLLEVALFCGHFALLLAVPIVAALFLIAAFTHILPHTTPTLVQIPNTHTCARTCMKGLGAYLYAIRLKFKIFRRSSAMNIPPYRQVS